MNNKIYGCEIKGKKYVVIYEMLGWNFYKIISRGTMRTTPTRGLHFKDCKLYMNNDIRNMGEKYLQLKAFFQVV